MTPWMDLEGFMPDESRQKKRNTVWSHLHVESKKQNENSPRYKEETRWFPEGRGWQAGQIPEGK